MFPKALQPYLVPLLLAVSLSALVFTYWRSDKSLDESFGVMNTVAELSLRGSSEEILHIASDSVKAVFRETEAFANVFNPASELSRLNASAADTPFVCSDNLWRVLCASRNIYKLTGGAFDPTIRPLVRLWRGAARNNSLPEKAELDSVLKQTGLGNVLFDDARQSIRFTVPGMELDLGGIAKGDAVDQAAQEIRRLQVRGIINLGGNLISVGPEILRIGVRDPLKPEKTAEVLELQNAAFSTSGSYERFVEIKGKRYSHIIDPRTGYPVENALLSSTVRAPSATLADGLSTALFVDSRNAQKLSGEDTSLSFWFITRGGIESFGDAPEHQK